MGYGGFYNIGMRPVRMLDGTDPMFNDNNVWDIIMVHDVGNFTIGALVLYASPEVSDFTWFEYRQREVGNNAVSSWEPSCWAVEVDMAQMVPANLGALT